jgi:hypothetical protein
VAQVATAAAVLAQVAAVKADRSGIAGSLIFGLSAALAAFILPGALEEAFADDASGALR